VRTERTSGGAPNAGVGERCPARGQTGCGPVGGGATGSPGSGTGYGAGPGGEMGSVGEGDGEGGCGEGGLVMDRR